MSSQLSQLRFQLPESVRTAWVSTRAEQIWSPRLHAINHRFLELEILSVACGLRRAALAFPYVRDFSEFTARCKQHGLVARPLATERSAGHYLSRATPGNGAPDDRIRTVVARESDVSAFEEAHRTRSESEIASLLGYPDCCRAFYEAHWGHQGLVDLTWPMAIGTVGAANKGGQHIDITLDENVPWSNLLWRWMGVRAVSHLPCSFACRATLELGTSYTCLWKGRDPQTLVWLHEILTWPVEWSSLHGIAEVRTPICKSVVTSDALATKHTVAIHGSRYPEEGAKGLRFPYQLGPGRPLTQSKRYLRGSQVPQASTRRERNTGGEAWVYRDNGFTSRSTADMLHAPLVAACKGVLKQPQVKVLDLGCGNGLLLQRLQQHCRSLIPYGVDTNAAAISHAALLHPEWRQHFQCANFFELEYLRGMPAVDLAILMVGRLTEVDETRRAPLLRTLKERASSLLLYMYPNYSSKPFEEHLRDAGLSEAQILGSNTAVWQA